MTGTNVSAPAIDIRPDHWQIVRHILRRHVPQYAAWAFGSRAKWTAKPHSDLDLAIITEKPLPLAVSAALADDFSKSNLPWKVDVVDWAVTSESFRHVIERDKVVVQEANLLPELANDWPITRIEDIATKIAMGPFGSSIKVETFVDEGVPIISGAHLRGVRVEDGDFNFITAEHANKLKNANVQRGDVIFTHAGNIGQCAYLPQDSRYERYVISQWQFYLRCSDKADPAFVAYFFHSEEGQHKLLANASQVGVPSIARPSSYLKTIELALPPIEEQRAIAHILGTLDDKIELNRQRNHTLVTMASALFQDWFVDFGPVHAKTEGREPYLSTDLWSLFPDHLDTNGKPEEWRRSTIGEEVTVCGGSTPSTKEPAFWGNGQHHWATPKDLSGLAFPVLLDTDRKITDAGIAKISSGLLPVGTVLLSSRAPIGYLAIAEVPTAINQGFIAMKCDGTLPNVFVLFWCRQNMDLILGNANGSTFQEISKSNFRPIPVTVPSEPVLTAFRVQTEPLYRHIVENERESLSLTTLRDTLLPKLISGALRIKDVEQFLERVA